jgi:hypothetical protein
MQQQQHPAAAAAAVVVVAVSAITDAVAATAPCSCSKKAVVSGMPCYNLHHKLG